MRVTRSATEPRIRIDVLVDEADRRAELYDATFWSLRSRRRRSCLAVWLYDERGSRLFEEITRLPEYYPTAAEREILMAHSAEIAGLTGATDAGRARRRHLGEDAAAPRRAVGGRARSSGSSRST